MRSAGHRGDNGVSDGDCLEYSFGPLEDEDDKTIYRPSLITVPKSIILQLSGVVRTKFPELDLIVSYSEHAEVLGKHIVDPEQIAVSILSILVKCFKDRH